MAPKMNNLLRLFFIITAFFLLSNGVGYAQTADTTNQQTSVTKEEHHTTEKAFNAGEMIIDHIVDSHEWHILTYNDFHLTVPLPIILWDNGKLVTFSSSHFHHGHEAYQGYKIVQEGKQKGNIVKVLSDGVTIDTNSKKPLDFSITKNVVALFTSIILLCLIFISVARRYKKNPNKAPKGLQSLLEPLILFVRDDIAIVGIGKEKHERFMPYLLTIFFFILINNLLGLIPIFPAGANLTGNVAVTMVLALFTFAITTFVGNKDYWKHIFNAPGIPWWLKFPLPLMPIVEFMGILTKPFVLTVRLFANMTAGHIIVLGFLSLIFIFGAISPTLGLTISPVSVFFSLFISVLELLVAFIQAYIFSLLSAIYFGMAIEEHHEQHS